jgi:hypothetical protein
MQTVPQKRESGGFYDDFWEKTSCGPKIKGFCWGGFREAHPLFKKRHRKTENDNVKTLPDPAANSPKSSAKPKAYEFTHGPACFCQHYFSLFHVFRSMAKAPKNETRAKNDNERGKNWRRHQGVGSDYQDSSSSGRPP